MKLQVLALITALTLTACKEGDIPFTMSEWDREARNALNFLGIPDTHSKFKHDYVTPGGVKVRSTVPVPNEYLGHIDTGIRRQIDRLSPHAPAWTAGTNLNEYAVLIVDPNYLFDWNTHQQTPPCVTVENDPGASCLFIGGTKSAGTIVGHDDYFDELDLKPAIVVAHQVANNWTKSEFFTSAIHNESEHLRGWLTRRQEPIGLFYHFQGANDVHPWVFWEEPAALMSKPKKVESCIGPTR